MTIYAIVNDLLPEGSACGLEKPVWTLISASVILQGGNPYFVPDFAERFEARTALAVRIGKLGKGVAQRFAHRYVDSIAPCTLSVASDMLARLQRAGLPWTAAISYDRCLAMGRLSKIPYEELDRCDVSLTLSSDQEETTESLVIDNVKTQIENAICSLSRDNTLKTGDIIIIGLTDSGPILRPGMKAVLSLNEEESLRFNIR